MEVPVEVERKYEQYNRSYTRLEAVANYLFACFNNKRGKVSSFMKEPPRQKIFYREIYGQSVKKAEQYGDFYATQVAPRALIILNHTVLGHDKTFQKRFKAVFDKFIPGLAACLQKGTGTYNFVGPGRIWDFYLTLKAFNATALVPRENWIEMTLHAFKEYGAFGCDVGSVPSLVAIRNAYYILREFNALDLVNWTKVTEFVLSMQLDNGHFTIPWFYGAVDPASTVSAYCFLNASNQLHLINVTRIHEIFQEVYSTNTNVCNLVCTMKALADFCYYNGFDFNSYFPNVEPVLKAIITSQNLLFGGFPYVWNVEPNDTITTGFAVDAVETYSVLWLFYVCDRFDLFGNDNITIFYPPLSPYSEHLSGSTYLSLVLSFSFFSSLPPFFALVYTFFVNPSRRTKNFNPSS